VGLTPDSGRDLIDIPKPDFNEISVHNTRPPAEMLSLGSPAKPASPRTASAPIPSTPKVTAEKAAPPPAPETRVVEINPAPKTPKNEPAETGVPLLHSGGSLSSFYQSIHNEILAANTVESKTPAGVVTPVPSDEVLAVPPPPAADYAAPPPIPAKK
jgi:hypothetical protein